MIQARFNMEPSTGIIAYTKLYHTKNPEDRFAGQVGVINEVEPLTWNLISMVSETSNR